MIGEKLDYRPVRAGRPGGHYKSLQPHWQLFKDPIEYRFASAWFSETGEDEFNIVTHYIDKLWFWNVGWGHPPGMRWWMISLNLVKGQN